VLFILCLQAQTTLAVKTQKKFKQQSKGPLLQKANGRAFHSMHEIFSRMKMNIRNVCVLIVETQDYVDVIYILSKEKLLIG